MMPFTKYYTRQKCPAGDKRSSLSVRCVGDEEKGFKRSAPARTDDRGVLTGEPFLKAEPQETGGAASRKRSAVNVTKLFHLVNAASAKIS
jgi:hypothetical protein